jgi:hypothetical protein
LHKNFLEICDFFSGRPLFGSEAQPAAQIAKPLEHKIYDDYLDV